MKSIKNKDKSKEDYDLEEYNDFDKQKLKVMKIDMAL
jgi:hypothetical protein